MALARSWLAVAPSTVWLAFLLAGPLIGIVAMSFATRGELGGVEWVWTWENYRRLAGFGELGFDPVYPLILARTVGLAAGTTLLCLAVGLPFAFWIAGLSRRWRAVALMGVMIPFWTNLLIRTYAWQVLLASDGFVARAARWMGWVGEGEGLYPGVMAVWVCQVCDYLPFMTLPLYASVEKLDWTLVDAARDLGARRWGVFWHALYPQIRPGVVAGVMLVFLPALGQFVIPDLLGGARTVLLGNAVQQQFVQSRDWPFGAAIAVVVLGIVGGGLGLLNWKGRQSVG